MAFCVPCGKSVEVDIRVEETPELDTQRSYTSIRTNTGKLRGYARTTYRTKWRKHKIAVCRECGSDVEFPDANTAVEALHEHDLRSNTALFKSIMWMAWPTLAGAAAVFLLLNDTMKLQGWLKLGAWLGSTLVVPPLVGYGLGMGAMAWLPRRLVDLAAVGLRATGIALLLVMSFAFFAWAGAPFVEPGTENKAALIAAIISAVGCLAWVVSKLRHVLMVRSRLLELAGDDGEGGHEAAPSGRRFRVPGAEE